MKGVKTEYLNLEDGQIIEADTLYDAIEQNPDVKTVILFWTWTSDYYTSNAGPFSAYVTESKIDEEYSFQGDREDALKYAENYDQWDGREFVILKGDVLYGYHAEADLQTSWNDGYDPLTASIKLKKNERILQMILVPFGIIQSEIPPTEERVGGIGSTGMRG